MTLSHCLLLSSALFALGLYGVATRRNLIAVLLSLEVMLNAGLINLVAFARFPLAARSAAAHDATAGAIFPLFVMAVAACEMALALAIVMAMRRQGLSLHADDLRNLNG
jgi:NADH:ubiquinone oxidoreductase subunit K